MSILYIYKINIHFYIYLKFNPEVSLPTKSILLPQVIIDNFPSDFFCDKPVKNNLSKEWLILAQTSRVQPILQKKSRQPVLEAAVSTMSAVRKQGVLNARVSSLPSFY